LALLAATLCAPLYPAGRDITIRGYGPAPLYTSSPVVATNGTSFLTLWQFGFGTVKTIYGSIADADGRLLSPIPFQIHVGDVASFNLVAFGNEYTLFWSDGKNSYLGVITQDGAVTNIRGPIAVPLLRKTSIATNGSEILIVGETNEQQAAATGAAHILHRDGSIVAKSLNVSSTWGLREVIASNGDFIVTATETSGIFMYRFASNGTLKPPGRIQLSLLGRLNPVHAVAASSGDETVIVWSEQGDPLNTLWSAVVSNDGNVLERRQIPMDDARFISDSAVVWTGGMYVATAIVSGYSIDPKTVSFHLDRSGAPVDAHVAVGGVIQHLVTNRSTAYGIGVPPSSGTPQLIATSFGISGAIADSRSEVLSITAKAQRNAAVASDGLGFMTAFVDQSATTLTVKAAALRQSGVPLNREGITIGDASGLGDVAIAHGSTYLVAWADRNGLLARRVANDGTILDAEPITITSDSRAQQPAIAWNGESFFVVWSDTGMSGALVHSDGSTSPPRRIVSDGNLEPRVAWNGKIFLVISGTPQPCIQFECTFGRSVTRAVRVAADGVPIDTVGIQLDSPPTPYEFGKGHATVASDGVDFLVAIDNAHDVVASTVKADGSVSEIGAVFHWFRHVNSDITFDGAGYVLSWRYAGATTSWLATARITSSGTLYSSNVIEFGDSESAPGIASNALGQTLIVVSENGQDPPLPRVRAYFESEMHAMPPRPIAPSRVTAIGVPDNFIVSWSAASDAEGVVIDSVIPGSTFLGGVVAPASQQSVLFTHYPIPIVYVRTFNAGGWSEAVAAPVLLPARRRAVSR
jgi:hypothetical protein